MTEDIRLRIKTLVADAEAAVPSTPKPDLPPGQYTQGAPEWHSFEHTIWAIGEDIRQLLLKKKSLRNDDDLQSTFAAISVNRNAKRGRQSFIMLLGYTSCQQYSYSIASQLDDPDVTGHVISTLLKMQAPDFVQEISKFLDHDISWIRRKAKAYCGRFSGAA